MNIFSPKRIINPRQEKFKKPAIIIANHQSHIDLMLMMLLHPKVLILTNRKNYTHFFYGKALQYADFIPSDMGYEDILGELQELIHDGYSFMIFPEGHRNDDGKIKRFHQGAFYLAEKLQVDILPIIIHGQNQLLKKSEFFLKRGSINTKFLPRINMSEHKFGNGLREQTKGINEWFRKEFTQVRNEFETVDYWADFIKKNFIYKGPVLEWYTKIKIRLEDNYRSFNEVVPRACSITDLGCGYGYLDFMLCLVSEKRTVQAIDYDAEKIAVANHCAIKTANIEFVAADITLFDFNRSDVFILNDVLHYLTKEKQENTIEKCIQKTNENGMIIIRDSDTGLKNRHMGTRISEFFSTQMGFNKTNNPLEFIARNMIEEIAKKHNLNLEIIDKTRLNSNLIYILKR
jgi:1-acyl-sn-glycerol-3-phosphate acyltransferase